MDSPGEKITKQICLVRSRTEEISSWRRSDWFAVTGSFRLASIVLIYILPPGRFRMFRGGWDPGTRAEFLDGGPLTSKKRSARNHEFFLE